MARASGRTPWEALHDPHLAFNATAMRAHDRARRMKRDLALDSVPPGDFGVEHIRLLLRLMMEEF
jgi:hypothetical protein